MQGQSITLWSAPRPGFLTAAPDTAQVLPSLPVQGSVSEAAFLGSDKGHHTAPNTAAVTARHTCREACEEAAIAEILIKKNISDISIWESGGCAVQVHQCQPPELQPAVPLLQERGSQALPPYLIILFTSYCSYCLECTSLWKQQSPMDILHERNIDVTLVQRTKGILWISGFAQVLSICISWYYCRV